MDPAEHDCSTLRAAATRHPRRAVVPSWALGTAIALGLVVVPGCSAPTAYCQPEDPVVTPQRVAPGEELHVEAAGRSEGARCEPRMPEGAQYEVRVVSEVRDPDPDNGYSRASLAFLDPSDDGDAEGTVRLPDDFPVGKATVVVSLRNATTVCDADPDLDCVGDPSAAIEVIEYPQPTD